MDRGNTLKLPLWVAAHLPECEWMDKAVVLIDGGYLDAVNRDHFNRAKLNLLTLSEELCKPDCQRFRTYYYNCPPYVGTPPTPAEATWLSNYNRYIQRLNQLPRFEIRQGFLRRDPNGEFHQKLVDVYFACDLVRLSASKVIQEAVIVAGDSDYVPAVKIAKEEQVITTLFYYPGSCAPTLYDACDERYPITRALIDTCKLATRQNCPCSVISFPQILAPEVVIHLDCA